MYDFWGLYLSLLCAYNLLQRPKEGSKFPPFFRSSTALMVLMTSGKRNIKQEMTNTEKGACAEDKRLTGEEKNEKKDLFGVVEDRIIGAERDAVPGRFGNGP